MTVRPATADDLTPIVAFEIEIARISFPDNPIVDPESHRGRVEKALGQPAEGTFVADDGGVQGWVWVSLKTNFLTGDRYANLRSLAVAEGARGGEAAHLLLERALAFGAEHGVTETVGKVHVSNVAMRAVYREHGFAAEHLTMRKAG